MLFTVCTIWLRVFGIFNLGPISSIFYSLFTIIGINRHVSMFVGILSMFSKPYIIMFYKPYYMDLSVAKTNSLLCR